MALTNAGKYFIAQAVTNHSSPTFFDNAHAYIGVGSSNAAFNAADVDLRALTEKLRKGMVANYPTQVSNTMTFRSSFGSSEANFEWAEWGVFNAVSGGTMLLRKVEALGTKANGQTWQLEVAITIDLA
jgi:hypothetical protein